MSNKVSWIAVKHELFDITIDLMQLNKIPKGEKIDTDVSVMTMKSGWIILLLHIINDFTGNPEFLEKLSSSEVLVGSLHEGVMWTELECWKNHEKVWKVFYNGEDGSGLAVEGDLPVEYDGVFKKYMRLEEIQYDVPGSVDYTCEIPIGLFKAFTGYKYGATDLTLIESEDDYTFDEI